MTEHDEGYRGPATLRVDDHELPVQALLDARHEPVDGRLHWFGRISGAGLAAALGGGRTDATLVTPDGAAPAAVGDVDPWGRYRVSGVGAPPFRMA